MVRLGYTDAWSAETDGSDGFTPLALAAAWTPSLQLGVAIIPAYTRGPALLAQSVAALAEAAPGRFSLGLGTSSDVIVSRWNGFAFAEPYKRVRDTIRSLRSALAGEKVDASTTPSRFVDFGSVAPVEHPPPIFLAALRPGMLRLAGREADGAILNWLSAEDVARSSRGARRGHPDRGPHLRLPVRGCRHGSGGGRRMIAAYLNVGVYAGVPPMAGAGAGARAHVDSVASG